MNMNMNEYKYDKYDKYDKYEYEYEYDNDDNDESDSTEYVGMIIDSFTQWG